MSCSLIEGSISSRVGRRVTVPLRASSLRVSQPGTTRARFLDRAGRELAGGVDGLDLNLVTLDDVVGGDVDLVAVDADVAVIDQLASGSAALGETEEVDDAVEAGLEELQEALARDATLFLGDREARGGTGARAGRR